jgi:hypothetical protein
MDPEKSPIFMGVYVFRTPVMRSSRSGKNGARKKQIKNLYIVDYKEDIKSL